MRAPRAHLRRFILLVMLTPAGLAALSLGFGSTAKADAPSSQGWWTSANPGNVGGLGAPAPPAPPDVPSGGLLVEGGPTSSSGAGNAGATAFAALAYGLPDGATAGKLTLTVAPNTATTSSSTLELCPLTSQNFQPEEGGPMSDAPSYNCSKNVTASAASGSYQLDVSSLVSSGGLGVAILPTSPADRVVLSRPDSQSLQVQAPTDTTPATPADTGSSGSYGSNAITGTGSPAAAGSGLQGDTGTAAPSVSGLPVSPAPSAALSPSLAQPKSTTNPKPATSSVTPGTNTALVASATSDSGPRPWVGVIFLVALVAAAALWMAAGRSATTGARGPLSERR